MKIATSSLHRVAKSTLYPIGLYEITGLATYETHLLAIDRVRGYLAWIDPSNHNTKILNPFQTESWLDGYGLAIDGDRVWFAREEVVYSCHGLKSAVVGGRLGSPEAFVALEYPIHGVAVTDERVYLTCQKSGYIHVLDRQTTTPITQFPQPGVGIESIAFENGKLWVCDRTEQTVYCLDPDTGELEFSILTPFQTPTDLAFLPEASSPSPTCWVAYANEVPYVRDDPNATPSQTVGWRDRTFIHPLYFAHDSTHRKTMSNGYLIEMSYVEEIQPLDPIGLEQVEWRIALPSQTSRQRLRKIESVGHPCTIETQDGEQVACFQFDQLMPHQKGLLGWTVLLEVYSMKYSLSYDDIECSIANEAVLPDGFAERYLVDNDDLAMDSPIVQAAAKEAVGTETNPLRKMHRIRNYVYERLRYGIRPKIDRPDVVLERGVGSCGEYVGVLLALARLNGIACRTIGRYKCPFYPELRDVPLEPDFNHVWLEFYVPGMGWLPMESNVDDEEERGPYPDRFFMGLAWYHIEIGKGIAFEKMTAKNRPETLSLGDLALNHIRFKVLAELVPPPFTSELD